MLRARFAPAFRCVRSAFATSAAIVVHEDGTLELIGDFSDELCRGFLKLGRFRQQLSNPSNPKIIFFQSTECRASNNSSQAEPKCLSSTV
jgi:hypothetical protein